MRQAHALRHASEVSFDTFATSQSKKTGAFLRVRRVSIQKPHKFWSNFSFLGVRVLLNPMIGIPFALGHVPRESVTSPTLL